MPRIRKNCIQIGNRIKLNPRISGYSTNLFASDSIQGIILGISVSKANNIASVCVRVDDCYIGYGSNHIWNFGSEAIIKE